MKISCALFSLIVAVPPQDFATAWVLPTSSSFRPFTRTTTTALDMAATVGIFYGTSTGSTQTAADEICEAFGGPSDVAAEPVDIETLEPGQLAVAFGQHDALIVGTPTWNTGADTERSGTGWDELYYTHLQSPELKAVLDGKKVAVFGLGDQVSYAENYADATGELYDVFESLGCDLNYGRWSMEGYEHEASKSIRGDKFCGLLLDMVNQEELTEERAQQWVAQLQSESFLAGGGGGTFAAPAAATPDIVKENLEESSRMLDETIAVSANKNNNNGQFTPHFNPSTQRTMWTSPDGRESYFTVEAESPLTAQTQTFLSP